MLRTWFAAVVRYVSTLSPELVWADALGPFIDGRASHHLPDPESPDDEDARLQAMLRSSMFM